MREYHKINSLYKREEVKPCRMILGDYALPEFEYLRHNTWLFTEKVDGTNIRVMCNTREQLIRFGGKTDNAQIPAFLFARLQEMFPLESLERFTSVFGPDAGVCLYGEGFGAKIQGGGKYIPHGCSFVLFDVWVSGKSGEPNGWWLRRPDVEDVGEKFGLHVVPLVGESTLDVMETMVRIGFNSAWGNFPAEGIVAVPKIPLWTRKGDRIITKLKTKDFKNAVEHVIE